MNIPLQERLKYNSGNCLHLLLIQGASLFPPLALSACHPLPPTHERGTQNACCRRLQCSQAFAKDSIHYQSTVHGLCLGSHYEKEKTSP